MADTTTTNLLLTTPEVGSSTDSWGTKINTDMGLIDAVFAAAGTGTSVGLNVGLGKTLSVAGTLIVTGAASTIDATAIGATTPDTGAFTTLSATQNANLPNTFGFKNRIINGAMVIDQRNAGASASLTSSQTYFVDRFFGVEDTDGTMTIQRSTTAPTGFINSLLMTTTSADASLAAAQICYVGQKIEGLNIADLAWGTASAATITISFWVRSSLTGTFGGAVANNAFNRSYPFTYTISAANTFEQKTITIAGDTTGTWPTDNGGSIQLFFGLGVGSTFSGTAGAWAGSGYISATGATSVIGTNGATFYITGVQLEKGSTATSFDYRPYGTELALCQRYFQTLSRGLCGGADSATQIEVAGINIVQMRASPTIALQQTTLQFSSGGAIFTSTGSTITDSNTNSDAYHLRINGFTGLTTGRACVARFGSGGGFLSFASEL